MAKQASKEVAKIEENDVTAIIPFENAPAYLTETKGTGLEGLGQGDFKIPRILMLQPLSPAIQSFPGKAIPGEFWHTGANISLGSEFNFIPCVANKRVILWKPRDEGGGMLAFSRDGKTWDMGGDQEFSVKLKGIKEPVKWRTGKDVQSSKLLDWGTHNPEDMESGPAATLSYEYLLYMPDRPDLSPVVHGVYRTALGNAKQFNTSLAMLRKPIQSVMVRAFSDQKSEGANNWYVTNFELKGWVNKELFDIATEYGEKHKHYNAEYEQDETADKTPSESDQY